MTIELGRVFVRRCVSFEVYDKGTYIGFVEIDDCGQMYFGGLVKEVDGEERSVNMEELFNVLKEIADYSKNNKEIENAVSEDSSDCDFEGAMELINGMTTWRDFQNMDHTAQYEMLYNIFGFLYLCKELLLGRFDGTKKEVSKEVIPDPAVDEGDNLPF